MIGIRESGNPPIDSGDPVLQVRLGLAALSAEDRSSWTGLAKSERLVELLEAREPGAIEAALVRSPADRLSREEDRGAGSSRSIRT